MLHAVIDVWYRADNVYDDINTVVVVRFRNGHHFVVFFVFLFYTQPILYSYSLLSIVCQHAPKKEICVI